MAVRSFDGPVSELVPHRASMLLIDRLLADDAETVRVEAIVRREGVFVTEEGLPAWVGIELMAQAVAAWAGLRSREAQEPVRLGFLLGTRRFECSRPLFPVGARLEIEARRELVAGNGLAVFVCTIELEGQVVARANLNAFQPPDVGRYLQGLFDA
jgi:predicted hotdog family 3-hydroxylacyl-ACP dehydratase